MSEQTRVEANADIVPSDDLLPSDGMSESFDASDFDRQETTEETSQKQLPFTFAKEHQVVLFHEESGPVIYHRPDLKAASLMEVRRYLGQSFSVQQLDETEFQKKLSLAYQKSDSAAAQAAEDLGSEIDLSRLADEIPEMGDLMDAEDDAPVIRLINAILSQAVKEKASDIHIETFEDNLIVRFRVDGVLTEVLKPKRALAPLLVSRLKVMAKLDIAEKRVPQDGRISVRIAGHGIDIRLSTIPSAHGERIVLRLLDKQAGQLKLEQLRMEPKVFNAFEKALLTPHGIILVTGPTGSGKTTSLYAGLQHINETSRNILTIEDPVEYMLKGIGQTQVNAKVDMTFARGLRAILRQDPDVVMVGEIRDIETGEIAVQASLTGHLVLSTLHTNTAIGAVTRLQDMGIEPFLISSSLLAVIAQRLVRTLCNDCKTPYQASEMELSAMGFAPTDQVTLYKANGCKNCNHQGFRGRLGIYEFIEVDDELRKMIHDGAGEQEMTQVSRQKWPSIFDDGKRRVLDGDTTLEEVMRVTVG